jgi:hypothetical protein
VKLLADDWVESGALIPCKAASIHVKEEIRAADLACKYTGDASKAGC